MNATELAEKMLQWQEAQKRADVLKVEIQHAVLAIGKTQTVGDVRASYSRGRKVYDYEIGGRTASEEIIALHTKTVTSVDWRKVSKDAKIEPVVVSQGEPSVKLKLMS